MNYQLLGESGGRVSERCPGTMTFGEEWGWGSNRDEAIARMVDKVAKAAGKSPAQVAQLDEVSRIELGVPTGFLHRPSGRDFLHGGLFDRIKH